MPASQSPGTGPPAGDTCAASKRCPGQRLPGYIGQEVRTPPDVANLLLASFPDRILDRDTAALVTGLPASTLVTLVERGEFPPPVLLAQNRHGWRMSDVVTWLQERLPLPHLAGRGWADRRRA